MAAVNNTTKTNTQSAQAQGTQAQNPSNTGLQAFMNGSDTVNRSDFLKQASEGFQTFFNTFKDGWTGKQQQNVLNQYSAVMKNVENGNITGRGQNGSFQITDPSSSGIDLTHGGPGEVVGRYLSDVLNGMPTEQEQAAAKANPQKTDDSGFIDPSPVSSAAPATATPDDATAQALADKDKTIQDLRDQILAASKKKTVVNQNGSGLAPGHSRMLTKGSPEWNFWASSLEKKNGRPLGYYTSIKLFSDKQGALKASGIHTAVNPGMPQGGVPNTGQPVILNPGGTAFKFWQNKLAADRNQDPNMYHSIYVYRNANGNLVGVGNVAPKGTPNANFTYENIANERKQVALNQQKAEQQAVKNYQYTQEGKRQVFDGKGLEAQDITRLSAIGLDIAAAVTGMVGGNAASVVTSGASTGMDFAADLTDKSIPLTQAFKNLGTNAALTAVSAIPVLGGAAKTAQVATKLVRFAPKIIALYSADRFFLHNPGLKQSWEKLLHGNFTDLTVNDLKNYNYTIDYIRSTAGTVKGLAYKKEAAYAKPESQLTGLDKKLAPAAKRMSVEEKQDRMAALEKKSNETLGSGFVKKYNDFAKQHKYMPRYRTDFELSGVKKAWARDAAGADAKTKRSSWINEEAQNVKENIKDAFKKKSTPDETNTAAGTAPGETAAAGTATKTAPNTVPPLKSAINVTNPDGTPLNGGKTINTTPETPAEPIQTEKPVESVQTEKSVEPENPIPENVDTGTKGTIIITGNKNTRVKAFGEKGNTGNSIESSLDGFANGKELQIVRGNDIPQSLKDNDFILVNKKGKVIYTGKTESGKNFISDIEDSNVQMKNQKETMNATKSAVNSIRKGVKNKTKTLADKMKKHQDGGILSAQQGTKISSVGVNPKEGTWRTLAFPKIQDYLYNNINDNLASWVNYMQGQHASILSNAMKDNNNFFQNAYKPSDTSVSDYQNQFAGRTSPGKMDFNSVVMPQAVKDNYFVLGGNKRTSGDWSTEGYKADNLYGGITDYRRLLGRKLDFANNQNLVDAFNAKMKPKGYQMYLAPNNYYMLRKTDGTPLPQYTPGQAQTTPAKGELGTTANLTGNKQIISNFLGKLGGLTDDAMSLGRLLYVNGQTRKRTNNYLKSIQPSLQQPYNVYSQIRGDYGDQNAYDNAGAAIQQKAGKIAGGTSDYTVSAGAQLEGAKEAAEERTKGQLANDQAVQQSMANSQKADWQNIAENNAVANKNNELINQNNITKAGIKAATDAGLTQNVNSYLMEMQKRYQQDNDMKKARQDYLDTIGLGTPTFDPTKDPELTNLKNFYTAAIQNKNYTAANQLYQKIEKIYDMKSKAYKNTFLENYAHKYGLNYDPTNVSGYKNGGKINNKNSFSHDTGKKSYMDSNTDNKIFLNSIHKLINSNLKGRKL